jgi:hypothetical protein
MKGYRRSSIDSNSNTMKHDKKKKPSSDEDSGDSTSSVSFRPSSNQRKGVAVMMCPVASN